MNKPENQNFNAVDAEEALQGEGLLQCEGCKAGVNVNFYAPIVITADSHDIIKVIAEMIAERTSKLHFDFNHKDKEEMEEVVHD